MDKNDPGQQSKTEEEEPLDDSRENYNYAKEEHDDKLKEHLKNRELAAKIDGDFKGEKDVENENEDEEDL